MNTTSESSGFLRAAAIQPQASRRAQQSPRRVEAARTGKADETTLAEPAHVLHDIREAFDNAASAKLGKTLGKDFANTPDSEPADHFL